MDQLNWVSDSNGNSTFNGDLISVRCLHFKPVGLLHSHMARVQIVMRQQVEHNEHLDNEQVLFDMELDAVNEHELKRLVEQRVREHLYEIQCSMLRPVAYPHGKELGGLLNAFVIELNAALLVHPDWTNDAVHAAGILTEEAGEVLQAANDFNQKGGRDSDRQKMRAEAIQTGAMALRLLLNLDSFERPEPSIKLSTLSDILSRSSGSAEDVLASIRSLVDSAKE